VPVVAVEDAIRTACSRWRVLEVAADPYRWQRSLEVLDGDSRLARHVGDAVLREDSRGARLSKECVLPRVVAGAMVCWNPARGSMAGSCLGEGKSEARPVVDQEHPTIDASKEGQRCGRRYVCWRDATTQTAPGSSQPGPLVRA
jgi:hypothetical protein